MALPPEISSELRLMVREVLRETMAQRQPTQSSAVETVRISSDHDLAAFVTRVIEPATLERLRTGKLRFTLGSASPTGVAAATSLTGVITEQKIDHLKGAGTLVLAPGAVLTPLARDKARRLGLTIERRR